MFLSLKMVTSEIGMIAGYRGTASGHWDIVLIESSVSLGATKLLIGRSFCIPYRYTLHECICSCSQACHMLCAVVSSVGVHVFLLYLRQRRVYLGSVLKTMASFSSSVAEC